MLSSEDLQKFPDRQSRPASHPKKTASSTASPPRLREQGSTERIAKRSSAQLSRSTLHLTASSLRPRNLHGLASRSAFSTSCRTSTPSLSGSGLTNATSLPSKAVAMPKFSQAAILQSSPELSSGTTTTRSEDHRESLPNSTGASTLQTGPQGLLPTVVTPQITTVEYGGKYSASPPMSECKVGGSSASTTGSSTPGSPTSTNTQSRSSLFQTPPPQPPPQLSLSPQPLETAMTEDLVVFLRSQMMTARLPNLSDKPQCSPVQRQTSNKKGKADAKRKALTSTPVKGDESFPRRAKGAASPRCGAYRYGSDPRAMRNHKSWLIRSLEHNFSRDDEGATIVAKLLYPSPTEYGNGPHGNTLKRKHYLECVTKINNEYTPDLCGQIHAYGGGTMRGYNRQRNIMAKRWDADRKEWEPPPDRR